MLGKKELNEYFLKSEGKLHLPILLSYYVCDYLLKEDI
jgi:hypothetical protein